MDPIVALLIGLGAGVLLGAVIGMLVARSRATVVSEEASPALLEARHSAAIADIRAQESMARGELQAQLAAAQAGMVGVREQLEAAQDQYRDAMERARREADERAQAARAESSVLQALQPVKETLSSMQLKVTELETQRSREHGELTQQLRSAAESEERLRATAESLSSALRNNATRGVWGETQLRSVVEAAGMLQHVNFDLQSSILIENRSARPDMVVHLPGGKSIAVDAKVPFNSYLDAAAISSTAGEAELARRDSLLKQHVKAVRDHVVALGSKSYWEGLDSSPELVVAFIPSEPLLSAAVEADGSILQFAFDRNVVLASPMTLYTVLKTVAVTWRHDAVSREAKVLFDVSRELYGRLTTLATHVDKLGRSIERSVKDYNTFVGSLERQVLPSARRISQLDESKVLPALGEIEEDTRQITQSDLTEVIEKELSSLDELDGVARPELDIPELPSQRSAKTA
jgi:DNA recombination protein RmuC